MIGLIYHNVLSIFWWLALLFSSPLCLFGWYKPSLYAGFWLLYHQEAQSAYLHSDD